MAVLADGRTRSFLLLVGHPVKYAGREASDGKRRCSVQIPWSPGRIGADWVPLMHGRLAGAASKKSLRTTNE